MAWFGSLMSALGSTAAGSVAGSAAASGASTIGTSLVGNALEKLGSSTGEGMLSEIGSGLKKYNSGSSMGIPQIPQSSSPQIYSNLNPPNKENDFIKMMNSLTQTNRRY